MATTDPKVNTLSLKLDNDGNVLADWQVDDATDHDWIGLYQGDERLTWFKCKRHDSPYKLTNKALKKGMLLQYFSKGDKFIAESGKVVETQTSLQS